MKERRRSSSAEEQMDRRASETMSEWPLWVSLRRRPRSARYPGGASAQLRYRYVPFCWGRTPPSTIHRLLLQWGRLGEWPGYVVDVLRGPNGPSLPSHAPFRLHVRSVPLPVLAWLPSRLLPLPLVVHYAGPLAPGPPLAGHPPRNIGASYSRTAGSQSARPPTTCLQQAFSGWLTG